MDKIQTLLIRLGLSKTEAAIYLAGLHVPSIGVYELTRQTNIKRPTVYHALEALLRKGLVSKIGTGKRLVFAMAPPDHLKKLVEQRIQLIEQEKKTIDDVLPLLLQRIPSHNTKGIQAAQYEGIEGVKTVVETALYCKSRHWDILAPSKNFFSEFDTDYAKYYLQARISRGLTARTLWETTDKSSQRPLSAEEIRARQPRYLPNQFVGKFRSILIVFDDKVALISSLQEKSAILITSSEFQATMSVMFEGLWELSTPYKPSA
jgi:sugar-specific transcriptional regulator TrmB